MIKVLKTEAFSQWMDGLKDERTRARIAARVDRLAHGNAGDVKPVGGGISELRMDFGPGYRVYFIKRGMVLIILLCGGDKKTQTKDIQKAKSLAELIME